MILAPKPRVGAILLSLVQNGPMPTENGLQKQCIEYNAPTTDSCSNYPAQ